MPNDPFELDKDRNPCTYKSECKKCKAVRPEDRPDRCLDIKCEDYTPCRGCKRNKPLDLKGYCHICNNSVKKVAVQDASGEIKYISDDPPTNPALPGSTATKSVDSISGKIATKELKITFPGTPPHAYSDDEKEYYNTQWKTYTGHYRDPSVYAIVHNLILLEVEMFHASNARMALRGMSDTGTEMKEKRLIDCLKALRDQLPEKDALDQSEDEMQISRIYESYIKETETRRAGGISRFISKDAIALAPHLDFPIDPIEIGKRLGYRLVDITEALNHFVGREDIPKDARQLLEFMGFFLNGEYALQNPETIPRNSSNEIIDLDDDDDDDDYDEGGEETPLADLSQMTNKRLAPPAIAQDSDVGFSISGE